MKKTLFIIIFIFSALIIASFPKETMAAVTYEVNVTINSVRIPERGVFFKHTGCAGYGVNGVFDCRNAEFRIDRQPDITVKDSAGNVVKRVNFSENYLQYGVSKNFTFQYDEISGSYSVHIHFYATTLNSCAATADCIRKKVDGEYKIGKLSYITGSGTLTSATCPNPPYSPTGCGTQLGDYDLYTGTSPDVYFEIATIPAS